MVKTVLTGSTSHLIHILARYRQHGLHLHLGVDGANSLLRKRWSLITRNPKIHHYQLS
jgi:hypothetical protein